LKYHENKKRKFKDKALKITKKSQSGLAKKALLLFPLGFGFNPQFFLILQLFLQLVKLLLLGICVQAGSGSHFHCIVKFRRSIFNLLLKSNFIGFK
jgi:hypothetical protein